MPDKRRDLSSLVFIVFALLLALAFYLPSSATGFIGFHLLQIGLSLFGALAYALPPLFLYMGLEFALAGQSWRSRSRCIHVFCLMLILAALLQATTLSYNDFFRAWTGQAHGSATTVQKQEASSALLYLGKISRDRAVNSITRGCIPGGFGGGLIALALQRVAGSWGSILILVAAFLAEMILLFNLSLSRLLQRTQHAMNRSREVLQQAIQQHHDTQYLHLSSQTSQELTSDQAHSVPENPATPAFLSESSSLASAESTEAAPLPEDRQSLLEGSSRKSRKEAKKAARLAKEEALKQAADDQLAPRIQGERILTPGPDLRSWMDPEVLAHYQDAEQNILPVSTRGFHEVGDGQVADAVMIQETWSQLKPEEQVALLAQHYNLSKSGKGDGKDERFVEEKPLFAYDPNPPSLRMGDLEDHDQAAGRSVPSFLSTTSERPSSPSEEEVLEEALLALKSEASPGLRPTQGIKIPQPLSDPAATSSQERTSQSSINAKSDSATSESEKQPAVPIHTAEVEARGQSHGSLEPLKEAEQGAPLYHLPPLELLNDDDDSDQRQKQEAVAAAGQQLEATLKNFNIEAKVVNITTGPAITRFELAPGPGVKVARIVSLADDIALGLAARAVRIEAPIPGKSAIGIEIPNKETTKVGLKPLIASMEFRRQQSPLAVALGRDIPGAPIICDLAKMPHLLIAGATGAGKSVCINTILASILYRARPEEVKLLMIDPKVVELSIYNGIPHLLAPVVTDPQKASNTLKWAVVEMTRRYELLAQHSVRNIQSYNQAMDEAKARGDEQAERLPLILIVIDELSDLMNTAASEVENSIARLTAMARAAGMHLIIATQRPSVDVITGVIKANIPSRIAFMVSSQVDSRTILDMSGAEKLLGRGDMLYAPSGSTKPIRSQGALITEQEVERVVSWCRDQNHFGYDEALSQEIVSDRQDASSGRGGREAEQDELFDEAVEILLDVGHASASVLQRRMNIGYPRAGKLIDQMEQAGYIGPHEGSKPRKLLLTRQAWELEKAGAPMNESQEPLPWERAGKE